MFDSLLLQLKSPSHLSICPRKRLWPTTALTILLLLSISTHGAYLLEIDTDGVDDGALTYNSHFSFGGDTTTASQSASSGAYGTTGGDSLFGGDGINLFDTYVFTYNPSLDADNLVIPAGTDLGSGNPATGFSGGSTGIYRVYATWPYTENVSGGLTRYTITTAGDSTLVNVDQNYKGNDWFLLGEILFANPASSITVTQEATVANTFVSMRSYGLLFEAVPEPATILLLIVGGLWLRQHQFKVKIKTKS